MDGGRTDVFGLCSGFLRLLLGGDLGCIGRFSRVEEESPRRQREPRSWHLLRGVVDRRQGVDPSVVRVINCHGCRNKPHNERRINSFSKFQSASSSHLWCQIDSLLSQNNLLYLEVRIHQIKQFIATDKYSKKSISVMQKRETNLSWTILLLLSILGQI